MIKIAICDDERTYLESAEQSIQKWADESNVQVSISTFTDGDTLLNYCKTENLDMVFLDIMMPLFNGMQLAHEIRNTDDVVRIVFLTSSPEFAVESYDVKASGYLLKPLDYNRLCKILNEVSANIEVEPENLVIKTISGYQKIYLQNIDCIEAQNKKVVFREINGNSVESFNTFGSFAETLTLEKGFFKCHRSYIVYIPNIDHFSPQEITTKAGTCVPISRGYSKTFKDAYFAYMFKKGSDL